MLSAVVLLRGVPLSTTALECPSGVPHRLWLVVTGAKKRPPCKTCGAFRTRSRPESVFVLVMLSTIFFGTCTSEGTHVSSHFAVPVAGYRQEGGDGVRVPRGGLLQRLLNKNARPQEYPHQVWLFSFFLWARGGRCVCFWGSLLVCGPLSPFLPFF